jgi:hypothetical protein
VGEVDGQYVAEEGRSADGVPVPIPGHRSSYSKIQRLNNLKEKPSPLHIMELCNMLGLSDSAGLVAAESISQTDECS